MRARCVFKHLNKTMRRQGARDRSIPTATVYQAPTNPIVTRNHGGHWVPTQPSTAARKVKSRSSNHCVGGTVDVPGNRVIRFESNLEGNLADILLADRSILHVQDQAPHVNFVDRKGESGRHWFDFLVTKTDGRRVAYAVKPTKYVESSGIKETLGQIRNQHPTFADKYVLATEREISPARVVHAQWILWSRRSRNESDIQSLMPLVTSLKGITRIEDLVDASGLKGRGFCALVCLIDDGVLKLEGGDSIGYRARVRLNPEFNLVRGLK
jgi:hypothetical protein